MDRLEASLSEEGRLRLLLDAITDYAIYMLAPDGRITSWNAGAQRLKGYTEAEALGRSFADFYTPEDRAAGLPERALAAAAATGRYESEGWRVRKDGTQFWANAVVDAVLASDGELVGFAKVTRDLTERRVAQQALGDSEEQFRRLVNGVTDYALYMLSPEGLVTNWNPGAERIKGYTHDEIVGHSFSLFYTPEDRAAGAPQQALEIARREGRFEKEAWRVRKDGTRFLAHVVIDAIRDERDELLGFAKITRDVTEQARTQEQLERTREQLFQAQKLEAIGQLTGGIAHDFNNLLTAILGSLELAKKRLPPDRQLEKLVGNAVDGAKRGAALTSRLLSYARRQDLNVGPTEVDKLVINLTELLQRTLGSQVSIRSEFPPGLPPVLTDPLQLETAIVNLAVNARDAMPNGGTLIMSAREQTLSGREGDVLPPGRYVRLLVVDSGEGMDAETLAKATEPFFTTKGVGNGTGLGLSMVHGLAEQSGGRLTLESKCGEGTTASIWLPVAEDAAVVPAPAAESTYDEAAERPLVVLAVDDDALVLMNTQAMLEDMGHRVIDAVSGREAIEKLEQEAVDLVITDQSMPQMSGSELAKVIAERWPDVPIVLATGYADLPPGAANHLPRLPKPFSQADLARILARSVRAVTAH